MSRRTRSERPRSKQMRKQTCESEDVREAQENSKRFRVTLSVKVPGAEGGGGKRVPTARILIVLRNLDLVHGQQGVSKVLQSEDG